ncbi:MAG: hypothetical protein NT161_00280 [Candidatus Nomurabacteria bacterium]|nr:hypothetical protein [Candidatus Nomurabacteria bacterium]
MFGKESLNIPTIKKEKKEISPEMRDGISWEEKISKLYSFLREKYPALEKIAKTSRATIRLLTALVILEGGQLFAQEIPTKNISTKDLFSTEEITNLNSMTFTEIAHRLEPLKKSLPNGKEVTFSSTFKQDDQLEGTDYNGVFSEGSVPSDTGMVGDAAIVLNDRHIERMDSESSTKKGDEFDFDLYDRDIYSEMKFSKFDSGEIKEIGNKITVVGGGSTKEEAVIEAMKWLSMRYGQHLYGGDTDNLVAKDSKDNTHEFKHVRTSYASWNGISFFKNIHIDKFERKNLTKVDALGKEIGKSDKIIYHVYVSAQKGIYDGEER